MEQNPGQFFFFARQKVTELSSGPHLHTQDRVLKGGELVRLLEQRRGGVSLEGAVDVPADDLPVEGGREEPAATDAEAADGGASGAVAGVLAQHLPALQREEGPHSCFQYYM